jgi:glycosyltransferase involved in cell wall biosynthesis
MVEFVPPVSLHEAHQHQLDADALLLITAPGQRSVASLKLFDYIGAGVPILALAEGNAAARIVQDYRLGLTVPANDATAIATALERLLDGWQQPERANGEGGLGFDRAEAQKQFDWHNLAGRLACLFDSLVASR